MRFYHIFSVMLCVSVVSSAATIESSLGGGTWNDTLTWAGYKLPGANDEVIVKGTISVTSTAACNNLVISEGAVLQNGGGLGWVVLTVHGNITNNGTIQNNPGINELWINIGGDIVNNGVWKCAKTGFISTQIQHISQASGVEFNGALMKRITDGYSDTFPLIATTDIVINATSFDGQGYKDGAYFWGVFDLGNHSLTLRGATQLYNAVFTNVNTLVGRDSSTVRSISVDNAINVAGCITLTDANVTFHGDVIVSDTLQNGGGLGWLTPKFKAKITNNGVIRNNPKGNALWLDCYGDVVNNGKWIPEKTYFASTQVQHISHAAGIEFNGDLLKRSSSGSSDTFPLVALSDIVINATSFNADGYKEGTYFWGILDMNGHVLTLKGPTQLYRTVLKNVKTIIGRDSSVVQSVSVYDSITIAGCMTLTDANVSFNGDVTIADTLQNGGGLGWLTPAFKAKLTNNGVIRNNPKGNELWIDLYGDVVNNGIWMPGKTCFGSTAVQHISQSTGKEFKGALQKKTAAGTTDTFPLVALSDIVVNAKHFDAQGYKGSYFWGVIDMNSHSLTLAGATSLYSAVIRNVDTLFCNDSAVVSSISVDSASHIGGNFTVKDANVHFNGKVTVTGILQNGGGLGWLTLNVNKGIVNHGTIRNNPSGNELWIAIRGDMTSYGMWTNSKNTMLDSVDQVISIAEGKNITAPVILDALWPGGPYQWQKNSGNWGGTGRTVKFDTISGSHTGVYQCKKGDSLSRVITIQNAGSLPVQPGKNLAAITKGIPFGWSINSAKDVLLTIQSPVACTYTLKLYAINGRMIVDYKGSIPRGRHVLPLVPQVSGTYLVSFESEIIKETRKIILTR